MCCDDELLETFCVKCKSIILAESAFMTSCTNLISKPLNRCSHEPFLINTIFFNRILKTLLKNKSTKKYIDCVLCICIKRNIVEITKSEIKIAVGN